MVLVPPWGLQGAGLREEGLTPHAPGEPSWQSLDGSRSTWQCHCCHCPHSRTEATTPGCRAGPASTL